MSVDLTYTTSFTAPDAPGTYRSGWSMSRGGVTNTFGITVWVEIVVE